MGKSRRPVAYAARSIRFHELWEHDDWRLKVYSIALDGPAPREEMIAVAKALAGRCLPRPAVTATRYGVGFMGIHEGRGANLVFVDWWQDENELHHHVFTATGDRPLEFTDVTGSGLAACVWDLAVIGFERQAWISAMLVRPGSPGVDAYLGSHFTGML